MAHTSSGSVCHQVQLQASQVHVSCAGRSDLEGRCSESFLGGSGHVCVPPCGNPGQGSDQGIRPQLSSVDPDCTGMAQHALVLGSGQPLGSSSTVPLQDGQSANPTLQWVSTQGSPKSESSCLAPRAQSIQRQVFSNHVQPEASTRKNGPFIAYWP